MPRRKKTFDYNDTFPKRLRQLISENLNITQDRLAEIVGVTRQTVGNWCSGESSPDAVSLKKIADCFDISIDWLLIENAPCNVDVNLSAVCKFTGLSPESVNTLHNKTEKSYKEFASLFFESLDADIVFSNLEYADTSISKALADAERGVDSSEHYKNFRMARFEAKDAFNAFVDNVFRIRECEYDDIEDTSILDSVLKRSGDSGKHNKTDK